MVDGARLARCPTSPTVLTAFLDELFELHPTFATNDRRPRLRRPLAGHVRRRPARPARLRRPLAGDARGDGRPARRRRDRSRPAGHASSRRRASTTPSSARTPWTRSSWVYLLGDGLFGLISREFAPLGTRLASVAGRLEGIPAVLDAARDVLVGTATRPVGRFQTETALEQLPGIGSLIDDALTAAAEGAADPDVVAVTARLEAARRGCPGGPGRLRGAPAGRGPAAQRGRGTPRDASSSPRRCATRCARRT